MIIKLNSKYVYTQQTHFAVETWDKVCVKFEAVGIVQFSKLKLCRRCLSSCGRMIRVFRFSEICDFGGRVVVLV